jgi:hypothetical protein
MLPVPRWAFQHVGPLGLSFPTSEPGKSLRRQSKYYVNGRRRAYYKFTALVSLQNACARCLARCDRCIIVVSHFQAKVGTTCFFSRCHGNSHINGYASEHVGHSYIRMRKMCGAEGPTRFFSLLLRNLGPQTALRTQFLLNF